MASKDIKIAAENLNCPVCYQLFNNPKYLPCHHSYCEQCLEKMQVESKIICPECRMEAKVPPGGVKDLDKNFFISRLVDESKTKLKCDECDGEDGVKNFCPNCTMDLCHACDEHHKCSAVVEEMKTPYNLVLIGETGSGKTSFLNLLFNCSALQEGGKVFDETSLANVKEFHDVTFENQHSKMMESKTSGAKLYRTKLAAMNVGIIDTPGFNDSRGFEQDKKNTEAILHALKDAGHINCVCLIVNGRSSRSNVSLKYVFTSITSIMPIKIVNKTIVILTNCEEIFDASFDAEILQEYFGKKIPSTNIFYIENPYCKYTRVKMHPKYMPSIAASFQKTFKVLNDIHEVIKGFKPVYTHEFVKVYMKKEEVELKILNILVEYDEQNRLQKCIKDQEKEIECALENQKLYEDYSTTQVIKHCNMVSTNKQHNTLCGAPGCYSNCHKPCRLDMSFKKEVLQKCKAFNGDRKCKECGHPYTQHFHAREKYVHHTENKCLINQDKKEQFVNAQSMQERADVLKAGYQDQLLECMKVKNQLSKELIYVISEFESCSISRNFAMVLENQLELIELHIRAELSDANKQGIAIKSALQATKDELTNKLDIIKKALPKAF